jgi:hypothetical protein
MLLLYILLLFEKVIKHNNYSLPLVGGHTRWRMKPRVPPPHSFYFLAFSRGREGAHLIAV